MLNKYIISAIGLIALYSCTSEQKEDAIAIIPLQKDVTVNIDGTVDEKEWSESLKVTEFLSPWVDYNVPETNFYVCSDSIFLYFAFKVIDEDIKIIRSDNEDDVALGDRVEIFLTRSKDLKEYYCMEIGPYGNVLDYKASFYRSFDNKWNAPDLLVRTSVSENGYEVEGQLPLSFLFDATNAGLSSDEKYFYMGVYRGDASQLSQGDDSILWFTWVDPLQKAPDFHVPSSFMKVCIE